MVQNIYYINLQRPKISNMQHSMQYHEKTEMLFVLERDSAYATRCWNP